MDQVGLNLLSHRLHLLTCRRHRLGLGGLLSWLEGLQIRGVEDGGVGLLGLDKIPDNWVELGLDGVFLGLVQRRHLLLPEDLCGLLHGLRLLVRALWGLRRSLDLVDV